MNYFKDKREATIVILMVSIVGVALLLLGFIGYQAVVIITENSGNNNLPIANSSQDEQPTISYQCSDNLDNDLDGFIDYPGDFGCSSANDNSEVNEGASACSDGIDNDGDGKIDQADLDCDGPLTSSEGTFTPTASSCDLYYARWNTTSADFGDDVVMVIRGDNCTGRVVNIFVNESLGSNNYSSIDQKLGVNLSSNETRIIWEVNDGSGSTGFSFILPFLFNFGLISFIFALNRYSNSSRNWVVLGIIVFVLITIVGGIYYISSKDVFFSPDRTFYFSVYLVNGTDHVQSNSLIIYGMNSSGGTACSDGTDNDGDGRIDINDSGCWVDGFYNSTRNNESDLYVECANFFDDDADGLIDYPADSGCIDVEDDSEDSSSSPACSDGTDNDGDGRIDYPADYGCSYQDALAESPDPNFVQCEDGIDNDGDGWKDSKDGACIRRIVNESNVILESLSSQFNWQCSDGVDNDGDGFIDSADSNCLDGADDKEASPCNDGNDNDNDGYIDSVDPGCWNDHSNPSTYNMTLASERYNTSWQCSDGVDNDGDGNKDGLDSQCSSWNDDSEGS